MVSRHINYVESNRLNNYAISSEDLATSLEKSSGALVAAGNSLEEAEALEIAGNTVMQDPDAVSNAMKVVSMRLRGTTASKLEEAGEDTDGVITDASKLYDTVKNLTKLTGTDGISIIDTNTGEYKSTYQIMLEISKVWDQLSDMNQAALLETMAGKMRGASVAAILQDPELLESAYYDAMNSTEGAGEKAIENSMDSIEKRITQLKNAWMNVWQTTISSDGLKVILQIIEKLISGLGKVLNLIGPVSAGLAGLGGVVAFKKRKDIMGFANMAKQLQELKSALATNDASLIKSVIDKKTSNDALNRALFGKEKGLFNRALLSQDEINKLHGVYTTGVIPRGKDGKDAITLPEQTANASLIKSENDLLKENIALQDADANAKRANAQAGLSAQSEAATMSGLAADATESEALARLEASGAIEAESSSYQNLIKQQMLSAEISEEEAIARLRSAGIVNKEQLMTQEEEAEMHLRNTGVIEAETEAVRENTIAKSQNARATYITTEEAFPNKKKRGSARRNRQEQAIRSTIPGGLNETTRPQTVSSTGNVMGASTSNIVMADALAYEREATALEKDAMARHAANEAYEEEMLIRSSSMTRGSFVTSGTKETMPSQKTGAAITFDEPYEINYGSRQTKNISGNKQQRLASKAFSASKKESAAALKIETAAVQANNKAFAGATAVQNASVSVARAGAASNNVFAASFRALAASIGISTAALGAFLAIGAGIAAVVLAIKKYNQVQQEQAEIAQKAASEYTDSTKSLDDYQQQYTSLQNQLAAAKGNAAETKSVQQEILALQEEINAEYGEAYGKIDLISSAYENQTDILDQYRKKVAEDYVKDNQFDAGLLDAIDFMESPVDYSAHMTWKIGENPFSDIENAGFTVDDDGNLQLSITGDPEDALEAFSQVKDRLVDLGKAAGDEELYADQIRNIEKSASALQEKYDKYREVYDTYRKAQIESNPYMSSFSKEIEDGVTAYREAMFDVQATGGDLVDSESLKAARDNLEKIKENPLFDDKIYGKYFQDMFDDAQVGAYDFSKAIKENENDIQSAVQALKGYSTEELQAMANALNVDDTTSPMARLRDLASEYDLELTDVIAQLERLGLTQHEVFSFSEMGDIFPNLEAYKSRLTETQTAIELMGTAMSELDKGGALSTETFESLSSSTSMLKNAMEMGANGYQLNVDKARELIQTDAKVAEGELRIKQALAQQQYEVNQQKIAALNSELNNLSSAQDPAAQAILDTKNALEQENANIDANIKSFGQLADQIHAATSAYSMWMSAQEGPDVGDQYESIRTGLEGLKELYDDGYVGSNKFKTGVEALFPENAWDDEYYKKLTSWFTEGQAGAEKFIDDMSKVDSEFGNIRKNADGSFDIDVGDLDKFLADANITETTWTGMMDRLSQYGIDVNWDEPIDGINTVKDEMSSLQEAIETEKSLGLDTTSAEERLNTLQEKLEKMEELDVLNKDIERLKEQIDKTTDEAEKKKLQGVLDDVQRKADELQGKIDKMDSETDTTGGGSVNATASVDANGNVTVTVNIPNKADQGSGDESSEQGTGANEPKRSEIRQDAFLNELKSYQEQIEKASKYEAKTKYGNVNLTDRQGITWNDQTLQRYSAELKSQGLTPEKGSISTVLGSWGTYTEEQIPIAFSPMLQTDHGAELLSASTMDKYINGLISKASADGEWTNEELLSLDAEGMEVDGKQIKNMIADIGATAEETSHAMHYMGNTGQLQMSFDDLVTSAATAGMSLNDLMSTIGEIPPTIDTSILAEVYGEEALGYLDELQAKTVSVNENGDIVIETTADTEESQKKIEELGLTGAEVEGHTITIHTDVDTTTPTVPKTATTTSSVPNREALTPRSPEPTRTSPVNTPLVNATNITGGGAAINAPTSNIKVTVDNTEANQKLSETKQQASDLGNEKPVVQTDATPDAKNKLTDTSKTADQTDGKKVTLLSLLQGTALQDTQQLSQTADQADGKNVNIQTSANPAAEQAMDRLQGKVAETDGANADVDATASDSATPVLDTILGALSTVSSTPATAEVQANDSASPVINSVIGTLIPNKTFSINANAGQAISSTGNVKSILGQIKDKAVTVTATTVGLGAMQSLKSAITAIKSKVVTITAKKEGPKAFGTARISGTAQSLGSAHATGSAFARGSSGKWGIPKREKGALVGELGQELVVDPNGGQYYTVGNVGAEFVNLPKDAIIFNHRQTEEILKNRKINSRGQAVVNGTAHARGNVPLSGPAHKKGTKASGSFPKTSGNNKKSSKKSSSADNANTKATNDNTKATKSNTDAKDEEKSAAEKLKEQFDKLYDWIEVFIDRTEHVMDNWQTRAEHTIESWQKRNSYLQNEMNLAQSFYNDLSASYNKYISQANASGLSSEYKTKVQQGRKNEIESIDTDSELRARIDEYERWYRSKMPLFTVT